MPSPAAVLEGLAQISRDLWWLAAGWHVLIGGFVAALAAGWRPSRRALAVFVSAPLLSVSVAAWSSGNPFNGSLFLTAAALTPAMAMRQGHEPMTWSPFGLRMVGGALIAFGWIYPHFLEDGSTHQYLWAAPVGLIPCPTLSVGIGVALLLDGAGSAAVGAVLGMLGLIYGLLGWIWLGVAIDGVLLIGAIVLLWRTFSRRPAPA